LENAYASKCWAGETFNLRREAEGHNRGVLLRENAPDLMALIHKSFGHNFFQTEA
jgi:hypothetical protein